MDYWSGALEVKAVDTRGRVICGLAAVGGNLDRTGDIIADGAFTKTLSEKAPSDVAVFIGHRQDALPVGVPRTIRVEGKALYTETEVFPGPFGDQLLATAQALAARGSALGMSIGYRARGSKYAPGPDGKTVRHLTDIDLVEYSFAARQTIANPEALVVGVKTADPPLETKPAPNMHMCRLQPPGEFQRGSFRTMERDHNGKAYQVVMARHMGSDSLTDQALHYPTDEGWTAAQARAHCDSHGGQEFAAATGEGGKMADDAYVEAAAEAAKATWSASMVNDLPDSCFLWIEPGAEKDESGKTVPRSKRHFPYKGSDGAVDMPHLRNAIARIPQSNAPGLTDAMKRNLQAKARRMLDAHGGGDGKQADLDGPTWAQGAVPELTYAGYALLDLAGEIAAAQDAWGLLGEDTKQGQRMPASQRFALEDVAALVGRIAHDAQQIEQGLDGRAQSARLLQEIAVARLR